MKTQLIVGSLGLAILCAEGVRAQNGGPAPVPYTAEQLLDLIRLRDQGTIDTNTFQTLVHTRSIVPIDVPTILGLQKKNISEEQLMELDQVAKDLNNGNGQVSTQASYSKDSATAPGARPSGASTNLAALVQPKLMITEANMRAAATSLIASGDSLAAYATNYSVAGADTNLLAFGTNLTGLGTTMISALTNSPSLPYKVFFSVGAKFQNPYALHVDPSSAFATLTNSGNSTVPFLEFTYLNRFVLRDPSDESDPRWDGVRQIVARDKIEAFWPFLHFPDIEIHLGFTFANSLASSNYSASTIAGGGEFYNDGSVGLPFMRYTSASQSHQLTLEGGRRICK